MGARNHACASDRWALLSRVSMRERKEQRLNLGAFRKWSFLIRREERIPKTPMLKGLRGGGVRLTGEKKKIREPWQSACYCTCLKNEWFRRVLALGLQRKGTRDQYNPSPRFPKSCCLHLTHKTPLLLPSAPQQTELLRLAS